MKKKVIILCSICILILIGSLVADRIITNSYLKQLKYDEVMEKIQNKESFIGKVFE